MEHKRSVLGQERVIFEQEGVETTSRVVSRSIRHKF